MRFVRLFAVSVRLSLTAAISIAAVCGAFKSLAFAQETAPGAPIDIRPHIQSPVAPTPESPGNADAPPVATTTTLIPGLPPIAGRPVVYRALFRAKLNSDVIARRVFVANVVDGKGSGFFLRTPDGIIRALDVTPEKHSRISFRVEVQRLALPLRKRQRMLDAASGIRRDARGGGVNRAGPLSDFFSDISLQPGDAVVTNQGIRIFRGTDDFPFSEKHFVPLAQWRSAEGGQQRLERIEREQRRGR